MSFQTFKKELLLVLFRLFQEIKEAETFPGSIRPTFMKHYPDTKTDRQHNKGELDRFVDEYRCKDPQQNINRLNPKDHQ